MKITRVITYEGSADDLLDQLSRSLPDGVKYCGKVKISVLTVGNKPLLEVYSSLKEVAQPKDAEWFW